MKIEKYLNESKKIRNIPGYKFVNSCASCKFCYHDYEGVVICQNEDYIDLKDWRIHEGFEHLNGIYIDHSGICPKWKRG